MKRAIGIPLDPPDIELADDIVRLHAAAGRETKRATVLRQIIRDGLPALRDKLTAEVRQQ